MSDPSTLVPPSAPPRSAEDDPSTMSFGDHLEELRTCCIRALVGVVLGLIVALTFSDRILQFLMRPALVILEGRGQVPEMQALGPPETFMMYLKMALLVGLILAMPWVIWQVWTFVSVGLYQREQKFAIWLGPVSIGLFSSGVVFMFYIVLPIVLNFFVGFTQKLEVRGLEPNFMQRMLVGEDIAEADAGEVVLAPPIPTLKSDPIASPPGTVWFNPDRNQIRLQAEDGIRVLNMRVADRLTPVRSQYSLAEYVRFVLMLSLAFGLAFELPLVVLFLVGMHLVTVDELGKARRYVILAIFAAAAILTPPDVISQLLLAVPMVFLFEASRLVARWMQKRQAAAIAAE